MGVEHALCEAAGLEQGEAQKDGVPHASPDRRADVAVHGDVLHQDGVDAHAYDNEECLEAQGEQGAQVILAHLPPFPVEHGRHGQRGHARYKINFHHAPVDDDENADGQRPHGDPHEKALEPQAEQRPQVHRHQPGLHVAHHAGNVDGGVPDHHARRIAYDGLRHVEHAHDDVPGVGDDQDRAGRLEHPLKKHPGIYVV